MEKKPKKDVSSEHEILEDARGVLSVLFFYAKQDKDSQGFYWGSYEDKAKESEEEIAGFQEKWMQETQKSGADFIKAFIAYQAKVVATLGLKTDTTIFKIDWILDYCAKKKEVMPEAPFFRRLAAELEQLGPKTDEVLDVAQFLRDKYIDKVGGVEVAMNQNMSPRKIVGGKHAEACRRFIAQETGGRNLYQ